jgi:alkylation response protein AidB-like acyl-CoA dehydrogenase
MRLVFTELQMQIADGAAALFRDRFDRAELHRVPDPGSAAIEAARWGDLARMGWFGLLAPEAAGGLGLGASEAVMLFREIGRYLVPGPLAWTVIASLLAADAGEERLSQALAAGERRAGLAVGETACDVRAGDLLLRVDAAGATLAEVTAAEPLAAVDPGTRLSRAHVGDLVANQAGASYLRLARLLVAAELLGIIEAARDMSAAYAAVREQFGKPIGGFQAVKHRCADMAILAYATRAQLLMASHRHDAGAADAAFHAAAALTLAIDGASRASADNIQNHGAIGFTAEHDAHLLVKRALVLEHALGARGSLLEDVLAPDRHDFY